MTRCQHRIFNRGPVSIAKSFAMPEPTSRDAKLKTGLIRQSVLIPNATPEQVYKAYLSSKLHHEFTGSPANISARKGAKFTTWDGYITGRNVALVKGKEIEQEWRTSEFPEDAQNSILKIKLKKKGKGTMLWMAQTRIPLEQVKQYEEGWYSSYWEPLKEYFDKKKKNK